MIIEALFGGNEELGFAFLGQCHRDDPLLVNGQFNHRRRDLLSIMEAICHQYKSILVEHADRARIIDSAQFRPALLRSAFSVERYRGQSYPSVMTSKELNRTVTPNLLRLGL